jgi:hypothetical protein
VAPFQGFKEKEKKQNESRWASFTQGVALGCYVPAFQAERRCAEHVSQHKRRLLPIRSARRAET